MTFYERSASKSDSCQGRLNKSTGICDAKRLHTLNGDCRRRSLVSFIQRPILISRSRPAPVLSQRSSNVVKSNCLPLPARHSLSWPQPPDETGASLIKNPASPHLSRVNSHSHRKNRGMCSISLPYSMLDAPSYRLVTLYRYSLIGCTSKPPVVRPMYPSGRTRITASRRMP